MYALANPAARTIATGFQHKDLEAGVPETSPAGEIEAKFIASTIAAGLEGMCSFDDFIKHTGSKGWATMKATNVAITLNPDADAISTHVLYKEST